MLRMLRWRVWLALALVPASAAAQLPADLSLVTIATNLGQPVGARHAGDGSGRLFIINRNGSIRIKPADGAVLSTPFLAFEGAGATPPPYGFSPFGEGGLLGLAFHPAYAGNGLAYVHYIDGQGDNVIARYRVLTGDANRLDPASVQVILRIDADTGYHKGGDLHFGPDGYLYIAVGDGGGGSGIDGCRRAQSLTPAHLAANDGRHGDCPADAAFLGNGGNAHSRALQAKLLRIDVDANTPAGGNELCASLGNGAAGYAIPPGNPFAGGAGGQGNCDEIWAYGLRNPYRFSFDRLSGDLFIGDVGEGAMEEVNQQPAGLPGGRNYGWPFCEGTLATVLGTCAGSVAPVLGYLHSDNGPPCSSITGGYRYRGAIPGLRGLYVFADFCSGRIHFAAAQGNTWSIQASWGPSPFMEYAGFGEDQAGELYLAELDSGRLLRFSSASADPIFGHGFQ